jgi:hypothetical protein
MKVELLIPGNAPGIVHDRCYRIEPGVYVSRGYPLALTRQRPPCSEKRGMARPQTGRPATIEDNLHPRLSDEELLVFQALASFTETRPDGKVSASHLGNDAFVQRLLARGLIHHADGHCTISPRGVEELHRLADLWIIRGSPG